MICICKAYKSQQLRIYKMASILVAKLREAAKAYYETETPIMSDAEYDSLLEQLTEIAPNHPFLKEIGAKPGASAVPLPIPMPSLDKKKPDTIKPTDMNHDTYIVSDKLDGISALWACGYGNTNGKLYLRGNGTEGQDVSHCIKHIQGLVRCAVPNAIVRGELIVPKGVIQNTLARNWVNGVLHQKEPSADDLSKIHFVAYQVCYPQSLTRHQQYDWLVQRGFEVVWTTIVKNASAELFSSLFKMRRNNSTYECDGIVVGTNTVPLLNASNPKDAYAFKMPIDDQKATTVVKEVEWASSRTGNWVPRIRFHPVRIGSATIEYCTGFHAQFIKENGIGPNAHIVVRRSGDVIPVCEKVLTPSPTGWQEPPEGKWEWDATNTHARDTSTEQSPEKLALEMSHQLVALGVNGISKTTTKKFVDNNILTLQELVKTSTDSIKKIIGNVNGEKLKDGIQSALQNATTSQWVYAFLGWPKGFGETRINALLSLEPDVAKWESIKELPKGISAQAYSEIVKKVPAFLAWRSIFLPKDAPATKAAIVAPVTLAIASVDKKGNYVMSGFRDKQVQDQLQAVGWTLHDTITKSTNVLIVPDDAKETVKVKKARELGIRIVLRSQIGSLL